MKFDDKKIEDLAWQNMHSILDKEMPVKKKRRLIFWYWFPAAIVLLSGMAYIFFNQKQHSSSGPIVSNKSKIDTAKDFININSKQTEIASANANASIVTKVESKILSNNQFHKSVENSKVIKITKAQSNSVKSEKAWRNNTNSTFSENINETFTKTNQSVTLFTLTNINLETIDPKKEFGNINNSELAPLGSKISLIDFSKNNNSISVKNLVSEKHQLNSVSNQTWHVTLSAGMMQKFNFRLHEWQYTIGSLVSKDINKSWSINSGIGLKLKLKKSNYYFLNSSDLNLWSAYVENELNIDADPNVNLPGSNINDYYSRKYIPTLWMPFQIRYEFFKKFGLAVGEEINYNLLPHTYNDRIMAYNASTYIYPYKKWNWNHTIQFDFRINKNWSIAAQYRFGQRQGNSIQEIFSTTLPKSSILKWDKVYEYAITLHYRLF